MRSPAAVLLTLGVFASAVSAAPMAGRPAAPLAAPLAAPFAAPVAARAAAEFTSRSADGASLSLTPCEHLPAETGALCGDSLVWENRQAAAGRQLSLHVIVLPAREQDAEPDPVVFFAGGPGTAATNYAPGLALAGFRDRRDIVLIDQRGTAGDHLLACPSEQPGLQQVLDAGFDVEALLACRDRLAQRADLTQYTTPVAMDDVAEVLDALGYDAVNLVGGSYGTRAALIFMRRHTARVRSAVLSGVAPLAMKNPLFHARGAQDALDALFEACLADPASAAALPDVAAEFEEVLARLERKPARTQALDPRTGQVVEVRLGRDAFAEGVRKLSYTSTRADALPALIHLAHRREYRPFVERVLEVELGVFDAIAMGMLLCVTCPGDVLRITEEEIVEHTAGTYLGDGRVRRQLAICEQWPLGELPEGFAEPVSVEVPTLILSGTFDPVTPPAFGELLAAQLPNSRHVVFPLGHDLFGPCPFGLEERFLADPSPDAVDDSCVADMAVRPFKLPQ
jgi:pimeloyl-ACP methyl ester carboxylesterase